MTKQQQTPDETCFQRQGGTLSNDKGVNSPRKYNNPTCVSTQQWTFEIHEPKTDITERRNRQIHKSTKTQHSSLGIIYKK